MLYYTRDEILIPFAGETLVELAYKNDPEPTFVQPSVYDAACPAKNDPLPGRGGF